MQQFEARLFKGAIAPVAVLLALMTLPYFFLEPIPLFPAERTVSLKTHIIFMACIVAAVGLVLFFFVLQGRSSSSVGDLQAMGLRAHLFRYGWIFFGGVSLSVLLHLYLVLTSLVGYVSGGGFLSAREGFLGSGLGIPLRLYMVCLPPLVFIRGYDQFAKRILLILFFLTLLRTFLLSERLAMLEYLATLWVCIFSTNSRLRLIQWLRLALIIGVAFVTVQSIRISLQGQTNAAAAELGNASLIQTVIAYYGDTQNKAYAALFFDFEFREETWLEPYKRIIDGAAAPTLEADTYKFNGLFDDRRFTSALNNPGGLAQDVSDFGALFGIASFLGKIFLAVLAFVHIRRSLFCLMVAPLFVMQTIEYARFNYVTLPFGAVLVGCCLFVAVSVFLFDQIKRSD